MRLHVYFTSADLATDGEGGMDVGGGKIGVGARTGSSSSSLRGGISVSASLVASTFFMRNSIAALRLNASTSAVSCSVWLFPTERTCVSATWAPHALQLSVTVDCDSWTFKPPIKTTVHRQQAKSALPTVCYAHIQRLFRQRAESDSNIGLHQQGRQSSALHGVQRPSLRQRHGRQTLSGATARSNKNASPPRALTWLVHRGTRARRKRTSMPSVYEPTDSSGCSRTPRSMISARCLRLGPYCWMR